MDSPTKRVSLYGVEPLMAAYGRNYYSTAQAQADLDNDKDFACSLGGYIGRRELVDMGATRIAFREGEHVDYLTIKTHT